MSRKSDRRLLKGSPPTNTPQGHADEMAQHVNWLVDNGLMQIATLDNDGVPYLAIMMKRGLWTLVGKKFILKGKLDLRPELYSR